MCATSVPYLPLLLDSIEQWVMRMSGCQMSRAGETGGCFSSSCWTGEVNICLPASWNLSLLSSFSPRLPRNHHSSSRRQRPELWPKSLTGAEESMRPAVKCGHKYHYKNTRNTGGDGNYSEKGLRDLLKWAKTEEGSCGLCASILSQNGVKPQTAVVLTCRVE